MRRKISDSDPQGGKCKNMFRAQDVQMKGNENLFAIGDVFMQVYFTIFCRDTDRIGFAKAVHKSDEVLLQYDESGHFRKMIVYDSD